MDAKHLEEMAEHGFTIFPALFSAAAMSELEAILDGIDPRPGREVEFAQRIAERLPEVQAFAQSDPFVRLSTAFLGPDTDLYFNQKVYKNPFGSREFCWHQDDAYGPVDPAPYLTVWIAVTPATPENGCVWLMPGSHRQGLIPHREGDFGLECHGLDDENQGVPVPLLRGDVACFWSQTMHKSGANRTADVRKAFILQFTPTGLRHKVSGLKIRPRIAIARNGKKSPNGSASLATERPNIGSHQEKDHD